MTNLTFAELTALIAANGLTVNDRYYITDKNWTIIAISKNSYRVVVPIVTEVTNAELDALVAANGLNEGLQYKVTDKNWLLIATSANTYKFTSIPYRCYAAFLSQTGTDAPTAIIVQNEIGNIVWTRAAEGNYTGTLNGAFNPVTTSVIIGNVFNQGGPTGITCTLVQVASEGNSININVYDADGTSLDNEFTNTFIEIRVYLT